VIYFEVPELEESDNHCDDHEGVDEGVGDVVHKDGQ
jgi:hypothetical protein